MEIFKSKEMSENIASFEKFIKNQWEYTVYIFQFWKNNFRNKIVHGWILAEVTGLSGFSYRKTLG